jgi:hypothetical protein
MTCRLPFLMLASVLALAGTAAAQDRTATLEKAKAKFEKEMAKQDEVFLAVIDKALAQAAKNNKSLLDRLTYERPLFVTHHLIPTAVASDAYLRERTKATNELMNVYKPVIADLNKAKKFEELAAIEDGLNEALKAARGYGLPFPDLEATPGLIFTIESKSHPGRVIDTERDGGTGDLAINPRLLKPSQFWVVEREERGILIRNVKSKQVISARPAPGQAGSTPTAGAIFRTSTTDPKKETSLNSVFKVTEVRRELFLECAGNSLILTATEVKSKGVTTYPLTQEAKESNPTPDQLWKLVVVVR